MGAIGVYFRQHRWQRRLLTFFCAIVVGGLLGLAMAPMGLDYYAIGKLTSSNEKTAKWAFARLFLRSRENSATLSRVVDSLDTENDAEFLALRGLLKQLGKFKQPIVAAVWFDRYKLLQLRGSFLSKSDDPQKNADRVRAGAFARRLILFEFLLARRDNVYVRKAAKFTAADKVSAVRQTTAMLAAHLGDDETLTALLNDKSPDVVAAAALAAGVANRQKLIGKVQEIFTRAINEYLIGPPADTNFGEYKSQHIELISNSAYALELFGVSEHHESLLENLKILHERKDDALVGRLLRVVVRINTPQAKDTVAEILLSPRWSKTLPPGLLIQTAAEMQLPQVKPVAMRILKAAASKDPKILLPQITAALIAARKLDIPCRKQLEQIIRELWLPDRSVMFVRAVQLLGEQTANDDTQPPGAPSRQQCVETLRRAATYSKTISRGGKTEVLTTPHASAAAAVSLWLLSPAEDIYDAKAEQVTTGVAEMQLLRTSAAYVQTAAESDDPIAGDYIAWNIAAAKLPQSFKLAATLLPAIGSGHKQYDPNARSTGAMLMGLTASNDDQRLEAIVRIRRRMNIDRFYAIGAYKCALLMLGDRRFLPEVREMLFVPDYSSRRVITSLLVAGDAAGLDWLLGNLNVPLGQAARIVIADGLNSVLRATVANLPLPPVTAPPDVILWEMQIMRNVWCINGAKLEVGVK